jgi:Flp pilus assembly protein TadB
MSTALVAVLGAGIGLGVLLSITGWRHPPVPRPKQRRMPTDRHLLLAAVAAGAGVLGGAITGWVVGAVLITLAVWSLPALLTRDKQHVRQLARVEAVAGWAEMMRDTLAAAAGLEQAILASATVAPAAIHPEVNALALRLETGHRLAPSLQKLSDDLADPTADLVIAALRLAATQQARNVSELLGSLAAAARELASMRMRIEASRARTRTSVRIIVATTCSFAGLLIVLNRDYVSAYDTLTGQLVLLAIGTLFAIGFTGLAKIATTAQPARVFAEQHPNPAGGRTR